MPVFEVKNIKVNYGRVRALKGVSLRIEEGQFIGLIGPNGSGKSTLLDTISGLVSDWATFCWVHTVKVHVRLLKKILNSFLTFFRFWRIRKTILRKR